MFGGVQFVIMFRGYALPAAVDWMPLLVLSLTVGVFEAVFFRGFVQGRLEDSFGTAAGVVGAATLYALYHVGYGMGSEEMLFLFGLGVVYAIAYRLVSNIIVLWPLHRLGLVGCSARDAEAWRGPLPRGGTLIAPSDSAFRPTNRVRSGDRTTAHRTGPQWTMVPAGAGLAAVVHAGSPWLASQRWCTARSSSRSGSRRSRASR